MDPSRLKTIENIRRNVAAGEFNRKAEPGDPQLDAEQLDTLLRANVGSRKRLPYRLRNFAARVIAGVFSRIYNRGTRFEGLEKIRSIKGPAIITSNHFDFLDCTVMHELGRRAWHRHIIGLSQATNFAMGGFLGFILKYYDMIPVFKQKEFMAEVFEPLMDEAVRDGRFILIYPEQEMWWHYRKPRPPKRGAYLYAAKYGVPLIPCFTEMTELSSIDRFGVRRLRYTVHIGDPVYPDPALSERENSFAMMQADYAFKKAAYERAYGRPLDYSFGGFDIAGVQYYSSFDCDMVGGTAQDCALPEDYETVVLADGNEYYQVDDTIYRTTVADGVPYVEVLGQLPKA